MTDDRPIQPKREPSPPALRLAMLAGVTVMALLGVVRWLNGSSLFPMWMADGKGAVEIAAERNDVREARVPTPDGLELYAWVQGPDSAPRKVIRFGGNAECLGPGADRCARDVEILDAQFLTIDYRGYGHSPGRPTEAGLYRDARGAYRFALDELGWRPEDIVLWGRSLGAAVAVKLAHDLRNEQRHDYLAGGAPPRALILEAPFTSIPDMAKETMGHLLVPHWLVYNLFDNLSRAPDIDRPVFLIHGEEDEIVPLEQGRKLNEAFPGPVRFHTANDAGHNDVWSDDARADGLRRRIDAFLEAHP